MSPYSLAHSCTLFRVKLLTCLTSVVLLASCSYLESRYGETCKSRAHIKQDIHTYLSARYDRNAPVRVGIIPFSVPANFTTIDNELPGVERQLAWSMQAELLSSELFPIVEVLQRDDWPGKKDDFFAGNHGALTMARDAGYDVVLVGFLEPLKSLDTWTVHSKLMDTDGGITIWYGTTTVSTRRSTSDAVSSWVGLEDRQEHLYTSEIMSKIPKCIVKALAADE